MKISSPATLDKIIESQIIASQANIARDKKKSSLFVVYIRVTFAHEKLVQWVIKAHNQRRHSQNEEKGRWANDE